MKELHSVLDDSQRSYSSDKAPGPNTSTTGSRPIPNGTFSTLCTRDMSMLLLGGKVPKGEVSDSRLFAPSERTRLRPSLPSFEEPPLGAWVDLRGSGVPPSGRGGRGEMSGPEEP